MRKSRKVLFGLSLAAVLSFGSFLTSYAGQWCQNDKGWWYENDDGSYLSNGWYDVDNRWYYFHADGYMEADKEYETGYLDSNGNWETSRRPVGYWSSTESDEIYWQGLWDRFGISNIQGEANGYGSYTYRVPITNETVIPDLENALICRVLFYYSSYDYASKIENDVYTFTITNMETY